MPPHLGEGLCSGLRDAKALAWRLELVLGGLVGESVLDSYSTERLPHARALVEQSLAMGKISCERDPVAAADRDRALRAAGGVEPWPFPPLGLGLGHPDPDVMPPLAGQLSVQGVVEANGRSGRLDDVVGHGFHLLSHGGVGPALPAELRAAFEMLGGRVVTLDDEVRDVDGRISSWMRAHGAAAVLVRPDYYVFGAVANVSDVPVLLASLLAQLGIPVGTLES
jgi:hypothetical protein